MFGPFLPLTIRFSALRRLPQMGESKGVKEITIFGQNIYSWMTMCNSLFGEVGGQGGHFHTTMEVMK